VLIVDDSVFNFAGSITEILTPVPRRRVVGKAADGEEALRLVGMLRPALNHAGTWNASPGRL